MTIPITLTVPPRVVQNDPMGCWAASFNSWSRAQGLRNVPTEAAMINLFSGLRGALGNDHGATESGIGSVSHLGFMATRKVRGVSLTASFFAQKLEGQGHIYLAYRPIADGLGGGHVVVVYGVTDTHALVMDPDPSVNFPCRVPLDWYLRRRTAIVGTPIINTSNIRNPFA